MALKKMVERLRKPVEEQDREDLAAYCAARGGAPMDTLQSRQSVRVTGEVRSVRIVPRAGAPAIEAQVTDGRGSVTAVFLGRRKIAGMSPGRRLALEGFTGDDRGRLLLYNPRYEFLPS